MTMVLIIEDNPDNLYLIKFILRRHGFDTIEAYSGEEGIDLALRESPDLILMDIQLPGIDGFETTRRIREEEKIADTPIIALTSFAMAGDREKALSVGCTGYIEKPIDPAKIIGQITEHLKKQE